VEAEEVAKAAEGLEVEAMAMVVAAMAMVTAAVTVAVEKDYCRYQQPSPPDTHHLPSATQCVTNLLP
jgi:hypothetical protein